MSNCVAEKGSLLGTPVKNTRYSFFFATLNPHLGSTANTLNTNTLFNREEKEKLEHGQPASKIIFSANYKRDKIEFLIRNTRFGKTSAVFNSLDIMQDEFFSAKILTDLSISYSPKSWFRITAGANNIFDIYPDPLKNPINKNQGILIYSNEAMPFGYNGGYYFLNMSFTL
jgi:iron complex outermembrane receptor protein